MTNELPTPESVAEEIANAIDSFEVTSGGWLEQLDEIKRLAAAALQARDDYWKDLLDQSSKNTSYSYQIHGNSHTCRVAKEVVNKSEVVNAGCKWPSEDEIEDAIESWGDRLDAKYTGMAPGFRAGVAWLKSRMGGAK